jgi:hypothetical protein
MYASQNIIRVITSRRMRWDGHIARMIEMRRAYKIFNLKGRDHSEDIGVDGTNLREIMWKGMDWVHVFEDRDLWRAHMITVMNLRIP